MSPLLLLLPRYQAVKNEEILVCVCGNKKMVILWHWVDGHGHRKKT
jgi:hypothetical protein